MHRKGRGSMQRVKNTSVEPQSRSSLPEVSWEEITEPGAYVERGTGDLYRIPKEALISGTSPVIHKQSAGASRLAEPPDLRANVHGRLRCAQHNIEPNF